MNISFLKKIKLEEAILYFSGGKDSIVSLDLIRPHVNNLVCIFLENIQGLIYRDELFNYYEKRYKVKILKRFHPDYYKWQKKQVYGMENNATELKLTDLKVGKFYKKYRTELNIEWMILGEKRSDDITRARKFYRYSEIDQVNKIIYPVAYFSNKEIFEYIKIKKLLQLKCYDFDYNHEITGYFSKDVLNWFKDNYLKDYYTILETFPQLESILYE